jgi:flagellar motor switch protein FliG
MEGFIRTTKPSLSGLEKVAILLAELGPFFNSSYDQLYGALHLSDEEIRKIRKAMKKLGRYAPAKVSYEKGMEQIQQEQSVLQEALDYGVRKGIVSKTGGNDGRSIKDYIPADIKNIANQNPEDVAKVLRSWLGE